MAYVIVNEAGASVYSTSRLGREEFPEYDATLARRHFHRPPLAGPVERTGEDRSGQHRRRAVSARREGQALADLAGRRGRIVRELRGRGREHGQPRAVALRFGLEPIDRAPALRISPRARAVPQPRAIAPGARLRRGDVRAGGRLSENPRRRQSAGYHLDPSGKLPGGQSRIAEAGLHARRSDRQNRHRRLGRTRDEGRFGGDGQGVGGRHADA